MTDYSLETKPTLLGSLTSQYVKIAIVGLTSLTVACLFIEPILLLPLRISRNYNEGWNALHAVRALEGGVLYPDGGSLITNNYPPLWFYITGGLGRFTGDNIVAGRFLALLSLFVVAWNIGLTTRVLGASRLHAVFTGVFFLGFVQTHYAEYVAMNDPQWLAHAFMTAGLVIILASRRSALVVVVVALLTLVGGLIKHNPVTLPVAISLWLFSHYRQRFRLWITTSLILVLISMSVLYMRYGADCFSDILSTPRTFSLFLLASKVSAWSVPLFPLLGIGMSLWILDRRERSTQLIAGYCVLSILWGCFIAGGAGIAYNAIFDVIIGLSIAAGLFIQRVNESRLPSTTDLSVMILLALMILVPAPQTLALAKGSLEKRDENRAAVAADIAFLADHPGPALCENLELCYWAGKSFEMDLFNTGQKLSKHVIDEYSILRLLEDNYFSVIQLTSTNYPPRSGRLPRSINEHWLEHYKVLRTSSMSGVFLVRLDKDFSAAR